MFSKLRDRDTELVIPPRFEVQLNDLKLTPNQIAFLYCYIVTCGHLTNAAHAARISKTAHYHWLHEPDYQKAYARIKPMAAQALLDAAIERAAHGVEEPVFYKGEICGSILKYSDSLMALLLKGEFPEKYGTEHKDVKMGNTDGEVFKIDPGREVLSDQKLAALLELGRKALEEEQAAVKGSGPEEAKK